MQHALEKKSGLGNPEIHAKTIKSQLENGTFAMMNPEVHKRATENRIRNYHSGERNCFICNKKNILNAFGICSECSSKISIKSRKDKFCKECNDITPHNGKVCLICHPESLSHGLSNFITKDNILYYYNYLIEDYVPWEDFKLKFKTQNIDFKLPEGFKLYPTFRTQDSKDWSGARSAFEQSLVDENIGWFVYIKFDQNNKPLVVGKSGSKKFNVQSDISFDLNPEGGPARKYLIEEGLDWNKAQIAIRKCNSEEEALRTEKEIQIKYDLFFS